MPESYHPPGFDVKKSVEESLMRSRQQNHKPRWPGREAGRYRLGRARPPNTVAKFFVRSESCYDSGPIHSFATVSPCRSSRFMHEKLSGFSRAQNYKTSDAPFAIAAWAAARRAIGTLGPEQET